MQSIFCLLGEGFGKLPQYDGTSYESIFLEVEDCGVTNGGIATPHFQPELINACSSHIDSARGAQIGISRKRNGPKHSLLAITLVYVHSGYDRLRRMAV